MREPGNDGVSRARVAAANAAAAMAMSMPPSPRGGGFRSASNSSPSSPSAGAGAVGERFSRSPSFDDASPSAKRDGADSRRVSFETTRERPPLSTARVVGFTCLSATSSSSSIVMGTADGRLRFADAEVGTLGASWRCAPRASSSSSSDATATSTGGGIRSVAQMQSWIVAGTGDGHVSFLDAKGGRLIAGFPAHDSAVTSLASGGIGGGGEGGGGHGHRLVTASDDKTIAGWDVRKLTSSMTTGGGYRAALLASFVGHKDAVGGVALRENDAFTVGGAKVAVFSLDARGGGGGGGGGRGSWTSSKQTHITPLRLRGRATGAEETVGLSSIAVLPQSRLFVVGADDGAVKICR